MGAHPGRQTQWGDRCRMFVYLGRREMDATRFPHLLSRGVLPRLALAALLVIVGLLLSPSHARVSASTAIDIVFPSTLVPGTPVVQTFYLTLPEDQALSVFQGIRARNCRGGRYPSSPIVSYFSIAIGADGTLIYYDQWEDGYAAQISSPTDAEVYSAANPDGLQIWGDADAANGAPPGYSGDVLSAGDVIILSNNVVVPNLSGSVDWDGKDKIAANSSIAMARAAWPLNTAALLSFAHEIYDTNEWGMAYESPVGADTAQADQMFEYSALSIMASQNDTVVEIDADADGAFESSATLQEGGSTLVTGILQGASVRSTDETKPIQAVLLSGDICSAYAARDMNLLPTSAYGSSYWSPVGVNTYLSGPTRLFLYNPSDNGSIHITCEGANPSVPQTVDPRGVVTVELPTRRAARCYASDASGSATGEPIFGIGTVDAGHSAYDWSFTLFPDVFLSTEALVGLGLGRDPNYGGSENSSPLWVTAACDSGSTYLFVDWNHDGIPDKVDLRGDNDVLDRNVDGLDETTSHLGIPIDRLQSVTLRDPTDKDQTGARVWTRSSPWAGPGNPLPADPGCVLAVAWGQDPRNASISTPGLDAGTSVPPLRLQEGSKSLVLTPEGDTDQDGQLSPGDTARYILTVKNISSVAIPAVYVYDPLPANTTYVPNSTYWSSDGSTWTKIPPSDDGGVLPLEVEGGYPLGDLAPGVTWTVRFDVILDTEGNYEELYNCDIVYSGAGAFTRCVTSFVASRDWGDLPDSYGTSRAANGPRHSRSALLLGAAFDYEAQGQPSPAADGDDLTLVPDDEDGVTLAGAPSEWWAGTLGFDVVLAGGDGCLNAWMDFTDDVGSIPGPESADGDLTNPGGYDTATVGETTYSEHIIQNVAVVAGPNAVGARVPPTLSIAEYNIYCVRFRLSPGPCTTAIAPTGFVAGGEVEDYQFEWWVSR